METQLKIYSLGIVIKDLIPGDDQILVAPIEALNFQKEGRLEDWSESFKGNIEDIGKSGFASENIAKSYIIAKWLRKGDTNRSSPPDVYASETVVIYKYSDVDEYYWQDMKLEKEIRRLEDVTYSFSNLSTPPGEAYDEDSSYWVRVSTRDKFIHIHTSKNDGEPFEYDIKLNTKEGNLLITDNDGNSYELDSPTDTMNVITDNEFNLTVTNDVNVKAGNNATVNVGNDLTASIGNNATVDIGNDLSATVGSNATVEVGGDTSLKSGGNVTVEAGVNLDAKAGVSATLDAPASIDITSGGSSISMNPGTISMGAPAVVINGVTIDSGGNIVGFASASGGPIAVPNNMH